MYDRYAPVPDISAVTAAGGDLRETVTQIYDLIAHSLSDEPRVMPAVLAEAMARPASESAGTLFVHGAPKMLAALAPWLLTQVAAGHVRDLPLPVLVQQLIAPIAVHTMLRPALSAVPLVELPELSDCVAMFADAFVRAVGNQPIPE